MAYKRSRKRKVKGLTADGSTRAWRRMRARILKQAGVKDTRGVEVDHIKPRRAGGTDTPGNLRVTTRRRNRPGRPKGS